LAAQMARFAQRYHRSFSRFKVGEFWEKSTQMSPFLRTLLRYKRYKKQRTNTHSLDE